MSNPTNAASGVAKPQKPGDFGRKLSGRKVLIIIGVFVFVVIVAIQLFTQMRWSSYLNRVEPRESFAAIVRDLRKYEGRTRELPVDLSAAAKQKWKWAEELKTSNTGISRSGKKVVSKFRYRQYEYLYARIDENTAVFWAVPLWQEDYEESWWTDMYTNHNELIKSYLADWKKDKQTWFVVLQKDRVRAWQGSFTPKSVSAGELENFLEPTGEWLTKNSLTETKAERWIGVVLTQPKRL